MNIGILTHYQAESHGACLQHYALTAYLRSRGHNVTAMTYTRDFSFSSSDDRQRFSPGLRTVPYYVKTYLFGRGLSCTMTMVKKHICLRRFCRKTFSFQPYDRQFDAVIIGSDEVWSLQTGRTPVLFGHGLHCGRLIAYAPSFGQTDLQTIQDRGCRDMIQEGLAGFYTVSARDRNTQQLVLALTGHVCPTVCDPVLLYDLRQEISACPHHDHNFRYIIVYAYSSDLNEPDRVASIRAYARSIGAAVYALGGYHRWCDRQIVCDPLELLGWFRDAAAVITDTFHGTICACLTETSLAIYTRPTNRNKCSDLIATLRLEDRAVTVSRTLSDVLASPMDLDAIHTSVQALRAASRRWLEQALQ